MPEYLAPGVYVEETAARVRRIEGVPTSTTGFIGATRFGPVNAPTQVLGSLAEFERVCDPFDSGRPLAWHDAPDAPNHLWHAARAFFAEGGTQLHVARVFRRADDRPFVPMDDAADLAPAATLPTPELRYADGLARVDPALTPGLRLRARHPGASANLPIQLTLRTDALPGLVLDVDVLGPDGLRVLATWAGLTLEPGRPSSAFVRLGNDAEATGDPVPPPLVLVRDPALVHTAYDALRALLGDEALAPLALGPEGQPPSIPVAPPPAGSITRRLRLEGGNDGKRPTAGDFAGTVDADSGNALGLTQFEALPDIALVAAPGATWRYRQNPSQALEVLGLLCRHAERMRYRVALLDAGDQLPVGEVRAQRAQLGSTHAALYHPWVSVMDPLTQRPIQVPPSAFAAGICARVDGERGVHKAPANEVLRLAIDLEQRLTKAQQDQLNPAGINCLRRFEGRGLRLWGARTISADPEWKYLNLRRYLAWLEHSIDRSTQWAVFESNGDRLWAEIRRAIEDFLLGQWQGGALLGEKPERAYFVRCDRSTMTQNDLDNGRLVGLVGVAPVKPAEFVIFRIGQWTADRAA